MRKLNYCKRPDCFALRARNDMWAPHNDRAGFTLAEVLITLGIIGVVAALTMPSLITKYKEKEAVAKLKKIYSVISQAYLQAKSEHGEVSSWCNDLTGNACQMKVHDIILPYLKVSKDCKSDGGCFVKHKIKNIDGGYGYNDYGSANETWTTVILADGQSILFQYWPSNLLGVYADINGTKAPNQYGKDYFFFAINDERIIPVGEFSENTGSLLNNYCSVQANLNSCAAWVIYNENMDYLHCDDLSWNGKTSCK